MDEEVKSVEKTLESLLLKGFNKYRVDNGFVDVSPDQLKALADEFKPEFANQVVSVLPEKWDIPVEVLSAALSNLGIRSQGMETRSEFKQAAIERHELIREVYGKYSAVSGNKHPSDTTGMYTGGGGMLGLHSPTAGQARYQGDLVMNGVQAWLSKIAKPIFDDEARKLQAEDPDAYDALYRQDLVHAHTSLVPENATDRMLGVNTLMNDVHFPRWAAEAVMYTALDPVTLAVDVPLATRGVVQAVRTARWMATEGRSLLQAMGYGGTKSSVQEVDEGIKMMLKVRNRALGEIALPPELRSAARLELTSATIRNSTATLFRPQGLKGADIVDRLARGIQAGKASARKMPHNVATSWIGRQYAALIAENASVSTRSEVAQAWLDLLKNDADVANVQRFLSRVDKDIDIHNWQPSRSVYYDRLADVTFSPRRGFEEEFFANPKNFLNAKGELKAGWLATARKLGLNTDEMVELAQRSTYLGVEGTEHRIINEAIDFARRGKSWKDLEKVVPYIDRHSNIFARIGRKLRRGEAQGGVTGVQDALINADQRISTNLIAIKNRLNNAMGGTLTQIEDRIAAQMWSGNPFGFRIDKAGPLMKQRSTLWGQAASRVKDLVSPAYRQQILDLNHEVLIGLVRGNKEFVAAINKQRKLLNLKRIDPKNISEEAALYAKQVRPIMDDMARRAHDHGLLDMEKYITDYMPKLYRMVNDEGMTLAEAKLELGKRFGRRSMALFPDEPFFSKSRNQVFDASHLITDVHELVMRYATALESHINMKPVAEGILRRVADDRSPLTRGEKAYMLEALFARLGKSGWADALHAKHFERQDSLLRYLDMPTYQDTMLSDVGRWVNRQVAAMYVGKFLGLDIFKATRNLTQQTLVPPQIGGGNSATGLLRMARGAESFMRDPYMQTMFRESSQRMGWVSAFDDMASSVMNTRLENLGMGVGRLGDVMPPQLQRAALSFYTGADMQNRVMSYAGGIQALRESMDNPASLKALLDRYRIVDADRIRLALHRGDMNLAERTIGEATVNSTQWLYRREMRPLFMQHRIAGVPLQDYPMLGTALLFMSWSGNYLEAAGRLAMAGTRNQNAPMKALQIMRNAADHQFLQTVTALQVEAVGHAAGIGGQGHWIAPRVKDLKIGNIEIGSEEWRETYGEYLIPFPALKNVVGVANPTMQMRNAVEGYKVFSSIVDGTFNNNPGQVANALERGYRESPLGHKILTPALNYVGERAGIEPDASYREDLIDIWFGPLFQFSPNLDPKQVKLKSIGLSQSPE